MGFWTHPTTIVARPEPGTVLSIAITLDIARAAAAATVTVNPQITVIAKPPAGALMPFAGAAAPAGYLACDGSAVSRTTYAALYAAIGTTYGAGDGSTTFNVPDLERRVIAGAGGSATSTLGNTVGATGGAETHTLVSAEMPRHTHNISSAPSHTHGAGTYETTSDGEHRHTISYLRDNQAASGGNRTISQSGSPATTSENGAHTHDVTGDSAAGGAHLHAAGSSGRSGPHNNLQPTIVMLWIISTG